MAEQDLDRNETATPYKLEKARERGSVPKSADINGVAIIALATCACFASADTAWRRFAVFSIDLLRSAGTPLDEPGQLGRLVAHIAHGAFDVLAPLFFAIVCVAVVANLAQSGFVFSLHPIKPDMTRLAPSSGWKRIVSIRALYEAVKNVVKLVLLFGIAAIAFDDLVPELLALSGMSAGAGTTRLIALSGRLLVMLLMVLLVVAIVDWAASRRMFARQMRMSRREVKDEHKQREGDPRIRARIRELRAKLLKRTRALRELPGADVLVTNPTRVAVALRYRHAIDPAPQVVARGVGSLARKMRDVAFRHQVMIVQSPVLARALYRATDDGDWVPEQWYPEVARILVWVQASRRARAAGVATPAQESA